MPTGPMTHNTGDLSPWHGHRRTSPAHRRLPASTCRKTPRSAQVAVPARRSEAEP